MTREQSKMRKKALKEVDYKAFDLEKNPLFQHGKSFYTDMMNPSSAAYAKFKAPYMDQFRKQNQQVAGRFGPQNSEMQNTMQGQQQRLSENLGAQRTQAMMRSSGSALNYAQAPGTMYNNLLNQTLQAQPYGYEEMPATTSWKTNLAKGVVKAGVTAVATAYGGPAGGMAANAGMSALMD